MANAPAGKLRTDPELRAQMLRAMEEIYALAHARGINLPPNAIETVMTGVHALPEDATSSMQRDIVAGKPSELESQNGRSYVWRASPTSRFPHTNLSTKL